MVLRPHFRLFWATIYSVHYIYKNYEACEMSTLIKCHLLYLDVYKSEVEDQYLLKEAGNHKQVLDRDILEARKWAPMLTDDALHLMIKMV